MTDKRSITVTVNGTTHTREVPVRITLADFIRYDLSSPARISAASTASAAPAPSSSTASRRAPA